MGQELKNWAGNFTYGVDRIYEPGTTEELQELVARARKAKALGSRHSFNDIADTDGTLIGLRHFDEIEICPGPRPTVTVGAGVAYGTLAIPLHEAGFGLPNLASLPHISVAGATATGTHGSGERNGNLATSVSGLELVRADGSLVRLTRESDGDRFLGAVVNVGALGVVTRVTLDIEPTFEMSQTVYDGLPFAAIETSFDEIEATAYSVSLFTDWTRDVINQVWIKRRLPDDAEMPPTFYGAKPANRRMHPIAEMSAENCTEQEGIAGPWYERMPHFRMGFTPSGGEELQTEYIIPRRYAVAAIHALNGLREKISPLLLISEIRTVAPDDLWLSPSYQDSSVAIHFTWKPLWEPVQALLPTLEARLDPFEARPHWGKLFRTEPARLEELFARMPDFRALVEEFDPEQKFRNRFVSRNIFSDSVD